MNLVSPQQLMDAAKQQMLDGREPQTRQDWMKVVNFFAANVDPRCAAAVEIVCALFDVPLTRAQVAEIVEFQLSKHYQRN